MACATPVICMEPGPEAELVDDGTTGFVVPATDPEALRATIRMFLADPALSDRLGKSARSRVTGRFTWQATAERCLAAYG